MTDSHSHAHGPTDVRPYIVIFVLLCAFTAVSFIVNVFVRDARIEPGTGFVIILAVAVVKALCVAIYFMHLKWDWGRVYFLVIPALVLAPMLVFALLPDLMIYWNKVVGWNTPLPPQ
jgi:cytochrome c oxidase subunit 4